MGSGHVMLPRGLEVVIESRASNNPITIPNSPPVTPTIVWCFQCQSLEHVCPSAPSISAPSVKEPHPDILNKPVPCAPALSVESSITWALVVQLQPQLTLTLTLPEWAISEDFESVPQDYEGGNVMVEESPTPFSLFTLVDYSLFWHFSFNNFITTVFPDSAEDLDIQI